MSALNSDRGCLSQNVLCCIFFPLICLCPLSLSYFLCCFNVVDITLSCVFSLAQVLNLILVLVLFHAFFSPLSREYELVSFLFCITLSEGSTDRGGERDLSLTVRDDFRIKCWMCISVKREIKFFDWELENWSAHFAANCTAVCSTIFWRRNEF